MTVRLIEAQKIIRKNNRTAIMDENEIWYSTFNGALTKDVGEGGKYKIEFETNEKGFNNLTKVEVVEKSDNELGIRNRNNQIVRQHSIEMSIRFLDATRPLNSKTGGKDFTFEEVIKLANQFDEDVISQEQPF